MLQGLDRLRHDAVVGADHQDHDIGDLGAARAHRCERRMARRVEERDHALGRFDVVGADVLRDAARFPRGHLGAADVIEQRSLAVVDVAHDGDHGRTRRHLEGTGLAALQIVLDDIFLAQHRRMAHLLDHQHGRILLDHLIDRRHDAHVHHDLDDFGRLDRHLLGKFGHGHRLADRDLAHDALRRTLEAVLGIALADRTPPPVARLLFLVAGTDVPDDVQLLPAVTARLVVDDFVRRFDRLGRGRLALAFSRVARLYLGLAPHLLLGRALAVFLVAAPAALLLEPLAIEALALALVALLALERRLGALLGLAQPVDFLLLVTGLIGENFALDVGLLAADLDIDCARPALRAGELQFGLGFAPERDLAGSGVGLDLVATVAAAQMREQIVLGVLADHVLGAVDLDAGLVELLEQPVHGDFQHLGELSDCYICHTAAPKPSLLPRTNACGLP